jgi:hypothetical protein
MRRRSLRRDEPKPLGPRELATFQHICKLDDDALRVAFGLSESQLTSLRFDPAWTEQIQYLAAVEATSPLWLGTLFTSRTGHEAAFRAVNRAPNEYKTKMLFWYADQLLGGRRTIKAEKGQESANQHAVDCRIDGGD